MKRLRIARLALTISCLAVFVPTGHAALPWAIGLLRVLLHPADCEVADWLILLLAGAGVALSLVPPCRFDRTVTVGAIGANCGALVMVYLSWAEPRDLTMALTAIPFAAAASWALYASFRRA